MLLVSNMKFEMDEGIESWNCELFMIFGLCLCDENYKIRIKREEMSCFFL